MPLTSVRVVAAHDAAMRGGRMRYLQAPSQRNSAGSDGYAYKGCGDARPAHTKQLDSPSGSISRRQSFNARCFDRSVVFKFNFNDPR